LRLPWKCLALAAAMIVVGFIAPDFIMPALRQYSWSFLVVLPLICLPWLGILFFVVSLVYWFVSLLWARKRNDAG
jgi:hypothetical protein